MSRRWHSSKVQEASFKGICMVVMLLFCSTKMVAISLGDRDFSEYFQHNVTSQARNWRRMNLLYEHLYP